MMNDDAEAIKWPKLNDATNNKQHIQKHPEKRKDFIILC